PVAVQTAAAPLRRLARPARAVHEQQVLIAVAVEVEERRAGAERLGQVLPAERAVVVDEVDAGLARDVGQPDGDGLPGGEGRRGQDDRAAENSKRAHSGSTSPFRTANSTSSAVLWTPSADIRFARCTATVLTLRSSITAISLFALPWAMSCSTCFSRCVSRS